MDPLTYVARLFPARSLVDTATGWLLGTEPPREMRGRLVDGSCLLPGDPIEEILPGLVQRGVPVSNLQFASLYLVRDNESVVAFDRSSSRRLVRFLATDEGGPHVLVRAGKRLDGTYSLISVTREDPLHRAQGSREGAAPTGSMSGRSGARARPRPVMATPNRLWQ